MTFWKCKACRRCAACCIHLEDLRRSVPLPEPVWRAACSRLDEHWKECDEHRRFIRRTAFWYGFWRGLDPTTWPATIWRWFRSEP